MDFSKVIFMTDLDGTLLTDDKRILEKDLVAIERFRQGGGLFTVATGRGCGMARSAVEKLGIDIPAVLFNGAAVYDFKADKFVWQCEIGLHARDYIRRLHEQFPDLGIEVLHEQTIFTPFINQTELDHLALEGIQPHPCTIDELPESGWLKVLLAHEPQRMDEIQRYIEQSDMQQAQWVRSAPVYYECLPEGVDKSMGYRQLIKILGAEDRFTVASGDYMNDLAMIQKADLGVAVASAQEEVKAAADLVVCDNNSGAIAEIINYIETL